MVILGLRTADWGLRGALVIALLGSAGCKTEDPPSAWEIVQGTGILAASKAVHPDTRAMIVEYERTGYITVDADSTIVGQIALAPGSTADFTGLLTGSGSNFLVQLTGLNPDSYDVLTSGDFPDTYALLSTAVFNSDVTGDGIAEQHRIYWEFQK